jgi:hypothetical protein
MRYSSEVVMLLSGWGILDEALLAFAVRALKSGDRDSKINAASALSPYVRRQHPVALTTLKEFVNDGDAAVKGNVLASLGTS